MVKCCYKLLMHTWAARKVFRKCIKKRKFIIKNECIVLLKTIHEDLRSCLGDQMQNACTLFQPKSVYSKLMFFANFSFFLIVEIKKFKIYFHHISINRSHWICCQMNRTNNSPICYFSMRKTHFPGIFQKSRNFNYVE